MRKKLGGVGEDETAGDEDPGLGGGDLAAALS
jgi:hypothetical protein